MVGRRYNSDNALGFNREARSCPVRTSLGTFSALRLSTYSGNERVIHDISSQLRTSGPKRNGLEDLFVDLLMAVLRWVASMSRYL